VSNFIRLGEQYVELFLSRRDSPKTQRKPAPTNPKPPSLVFNTHKTAENKQTNNLYFIVFQNG
jgi:hypothetical protein